MKITKSTLRKIIKEELDAVMSEGVLDITKILNRYLVHVVRRVVELDEAPEEAIENFIKLAVDEWRDPAINPDDPEFIPDLRAALEQSAEQVRDLVPYAHARKKREEQHRIWQRQQLRKHTPPDMPDPALDPVDPEEWADWRKY